ncbi:MAG TPA: AIR synthase-related protein [Spirochaetia bacterium]|nr:AIR synthase-related protein [Spirochaetia bacterium]
MTDARLEIVTPNRYRDGRADRLLHGLRAAFPGAVRSCRIVDVVLLQGIDGLSPAIASEVFCDEVAQEMLVDEHVAAREPGWDFLVEVTARPGVTDPVALTAREALGVCLPGGVPGAAVIQTAVQYLLELEAAVDQQALARFFHNPLVQSATCISRARWNEGLRPPARYAHHVAESPAEVAVFDLDGLSDSRLEALSRDRLLALSREEMRAVQAHFQDPQVTASRRSRGLPPGPTDVELEMIAQTWSEHCKHKIFNAVVRYCDAGESSGSEQVIRSLFRTYIRDTTDHVARERRFLRSVFHDNSGVIAFDSSTLVCFKVETHNSPSALDPYGGAMTGIVGVNRDILGTGLGALPAFNTNVLCFASPDTPAPDVPAGLLHPSRVLEGVHRGIVDGGNQSGIPVAAGAFLFDESYLGKPLVFCGTGGVLPRRVAGRDSCVKEVKPGDLAVMVGGRIGKDGIHGATFSSEALSETSPTSAVQIGDPITQKKMADFLLEARDAGLYRGLTDNGAGGLSSSLGEMAGLSGGITIDLDACPLKYPGLAPWEILVSESQERMSLAVAPHQREALLSLARRRGVEATVVGTFTDSGRADVTSGGKLVASLELSFLHGGLPEMELPARWVPPASAAPAGAASAGLAATEVTDLARLLVDVMGDLNVRSREEWVRCYDHEVQGRSVVKPFVGRRRDGPSDGAVLLVRDDSWQGLTVTHGICPRYGDHDTFHMAQCAVDEAVRAHVALGGDPRRMSALDNFCWPDPVEGPDNPDGAFKMAQLVRACRGLAEACRAYRLPLISGKDSMKNDARVGGRKISIRPTLLVSLMGTIADARRAQTTDFKSAGDLVYAVGETRGELGGTVLERRLGRPLGPCPSVRLPEAWDLYRRLAGALRRGLVRSCHDCSDAGVWAAIAECALGGDLGAEVSLDALPLAPVIDADPVRMLFCETPSRFVVSVSPAHRRQWERAMRSLPMGLLGVVTREPSIVVKRRGNVLAAASLEDLRHAWSGQGGDRA